MKTAHILIAIGITSLLVQACDKAEPHDETAQIEQEPLFCSDTMPLGPPPTPSFSDYDCPGLVTQDPGTFSLVNETSVPIRIAYGPYDGACLPPQLPTDTYIAPGDSISKHLEVGSCTGGYVPATDFFTHTIFPSNNLMVIFNEKRFVKHVNQAAFVKNLDAEDWCRKSSTEEGRNPFCGHDYTSTHWTWTMGDLPDERFRSYTFTEADRQRAQPLPREP